MPPIHRRTLAMPPVSCVATASVCESLGPDAGGVDQAAPDEDPRTRTRHGRGGRDRSGGRRRSPPGDRRATGAPGTCPAGHRGRCRAPCRGPAGRAVAPRHVHGRPDRRTGPVGGAAAGARLRCGGRPGRGAGRGERAV